MTINGYEFDIDLTDANIVEKMEQGVENLYKEAERLKGLHNEEKITTAEGIRQECKVLKDFFDYVFGEGTSEKIFKGKDSLTLCLNAYEDVIKARDEQYNTLNEKINAYSPDRLKR